MEISLFVTSEDLPTWRLGPPAPRGACKSQKFILTVFYIRYFSYGNVREDGLPTTWKENVQTAI